MTEKLAEKYVCNGCDWVCVIHPNTIVIKMPSKCPFTEEEQKTHWMRDCR
jgi:hypothetical protein